MDYGDDYWGFCRDYYRDPIPRFPTKNQTEDGTTALQLAVQHQKDTRPLSGPFFSFCSPRFLILVAE